MCTIRARLVAFPEEDGRRISSQFSFCAFGRPEATVDEVALMENWFSVFHHNCTKLFPCIADGKSIFHHIHCVVYQICPEIFPALPCMSLLNGGCRQNSDHHYSHFSSSRKNTKQRRLRETSKKKERETRPRETSKKKRGKQKQRVKRRDRQWRETVKEERDREIEKEEREAKAVRDRKIDFSSFFFLLKQF